MNSYLLVAVLGVIDLWLTIPVIVAHQIPPWAAMAVAGASSAAGATAATLLSARFRNWVVATFSARPYLSERTQRFMDKYGTIGVGLLAPVILGPVLSCAAAIALGANARKLAIYAAAGSFMWAAGLGIALAGMHAFKGAWF